MGGLIVVLFLIITGQVRVCDSFFGRLKSAFAKASADKKHVPLSRADPSTPLGTSTIASACAFGRKFVDF